jgi:hypothetical protein
MKRLLVVFICMTVTLLLIGCAGTGERKVIVNGTEYTVSGAVDSANPTIATLTVSPDPLKPAEITPTVVVATITPTFAIPTPADGAVDVAIDTPFYWQPIPGAKEYQFYLSIDQGFSKDGEWIRNLVCSYHPKVYTNNLQPPFTLEYGTTYYWQVNSTLGVFSDGQLSKFSTEPKP